MHYNSTRFLFVNLDASKRWGFATMIYYLKLDRLSKNKVARADVQSIMFLSRYLNTIEYNYWPTKLEVADIV